MVVTMIQNAKTKTQRVGNFYTTQLNPKGNYSKLVKNPKFTPTKQVDLHRKLVLGFLLNLTMNRLNLNVKGVYNG